jgi:hypothetical protein
VRWMNKHPDALPKYSRKLLGFTDNCKFAGNSDPLRGIIASNSDPF